MLPNPPRRRIAPTPVAAGSTSTLLNGASAAAPFSSSALGPSTAATAGSSEPRPSTLPGRRINVPIPPNGCLVLSYSAVRGVASDHLDLCRNYLQYARFQIGDKNGFSTHFLSLTARQGEREEMQGGRPSSCHASSHCSSCASRPATYAGARPCVALLSQSGVLRSQAGLTMAAASDLPNPRVHDHAWMGRGYHVTMPAPMHRPR